MNFTLNLISKDTHIVSSIYLVIFTLTADVLDHILLTLPNDTQCPCSAYSCERRGGGTGFHMAVAIVRKMKRNKG